MNEQIEPNAVEETPAPPTEPEKKPVKKVPLMVAAYDYLELFALTAIFVILLFTFLTRLTSVVGPSMEVTLFENQKLLVSDLFYDPKPGDIIVFHELGDYNEPIVKRVIATEGQTVEVVITDEVWELYVDGLPVDEPYRYVDDSHRLTSDLDYPVTVPEGCLFVMGDNRNHSSDSRNSRMGQGGFIDERQVLGKVILRLTPLELFGPVN